MNVISETQKKHTMQAHGDSGLILLLPRRVIGVLQGVCPTKHEQKLSHDLVCKSFARG